MEMTLEMKILIVTDALGIDQFGVARVVLQLADFYEQAGISYRILAATLGQIPASRLPFVQQVPGLPTANLPGISHWHPATRKFIQKHIDNFAPDVVHVHGCITPLTGIAVSTAASKNVPTLLSAHGMLDPWLWRYRGIGFFILKSLYWKILQRPALRKAHFVHAITRDEARLMRKEFPTAAQVLIPNAIDFHALANRIYTEPEPYFLFVGRLHPKKGVEMLLHAFRQASLPGSWRLVVVGPDFDPRYSLKLRQIVSDANLRQRVSFLGPIFDDRKQDLMQRAWAVVVPSFGEVVALVNLEAAMVRTPTITTLETGVEEWDEHGGLTVKPDVGDLTRALERSASWEPEERLRRGRQLQEWVRRFYDWSEIGPQWLRAYRRVIGGTDIPNSGKMP